MKIDARNLECPKPVVLTKNALEEIGNEGVLEILLNSEVSRENVSRFLRQQGFTIEVKDLGEGECCFTVVKGYECDVLLPRRRSTDSKVLFVKSDHIGDDAVLGAKLIRGFLAAMLSTTDKPSKIIFVNSGVLLTTKQENDDVIQTLKKLVELGVEVYSCGACLEHYGLTKELKVGVVGNALETVETLLGSNQVVTL